jgi:hypothetical protein
MGMSISGLEVFDLDLRGLKKLGDRFGVVHVHLKTYDITPSVVARRPGDRHQYLRVRAERWISRIRRRFPLRVFEVKDDTRIPSSLRSQVAAREIPELAALPGVRSVHVARVHGLRARKKARATADWYCVRAQVAIQVEDQTHGMQTIEERFVLVRALSFEDAERRLRPQWQSYAEPYLNPDGELVRWQLEKVVDVYATGGPELEPTGAEVYSKLLGRRMRPEHVWRPSRRRQTGR